MFPENVTLNKMRKYPGRWSHFVWWSRAKVNWYLNFLEKYWKFGFVHFLSEIFLNMEMFTGSEVKLVMSHLLQRLHSKSSVLLIIFQLSILRVKWHTVAWQNVIFSFTIHTYVKSFAIGCLGSIDQPKKFFYQLYKVTIYCD